MTALRLRCDRCRRLLGAAESTVRVSAARVWEDDNADASGEYATVRVEVCSHCARDVGGEERRA
jgi:hypothetical protein